MNDLLSQIKDKWTDILLAVKREHDLSDVSIKYWFEPLILNSVINDHLFIVVSDSFFLDVMKKKHYNYFLQMAIEEVTGKELQIEFVTEEDVPDTKNPSRTDPLNTQDNTAAILQKANLNPIYTFDTFVVGANNRFAHAAALAVAESPGESYNPLFIYGGVGLGKTHLMHSIANFAIKKNKNTKVLYVTSEKFMNELIEAIKRNKNGSATAEFREKYRKIDILLIDDIQFLIGKESSQEEFFHTFNALYEEKKQIIISSDRPPKEMDRLEERLRSRFEWGLTADIQSPDYETRMAILRKKEEMANFNIDNEVIKYIATNVKSNIRELEGALTKIVALSKLQKNKNIDIALAQEALKDIVSPEGSDLIGPERIIQLVAEQYNISAEDLISKKRTKEISYPRQVAMYLCRSITDCSLQEIAAALKREDHSTIIYGINKISDDIKTDMSLAATVDSLKKKLSSS